MKSEKVKRVLELLKINDKYDERVQVRMIAIVNQCKLGNKEIVLKKGQTYEVCYKKLAKQVILYDPYLDETLIEYVDNHNDLTFSQFLENFIIASKRKTYCYIEVPTSQNKDIASYVHAIPGIHVVREWERFRSGTEEISAAATVICTESDTEISQLAVHIRSIFERKSNDVQAIDKQVDDIFLIDIDPMEYDLEEKGRV